MYFVALNHFQTTGQFNYFSEQVFLLLLPVQYRPGRTNANSTALRLVLLIAQVTSSFVSLSIEPSIVIQTRRVRSCWLYELSIGLGPPPQPLLCPK
jgi:hypothetical protein